MSSVVSDDDNVHNDPGDRNGQATYCYGSVGNRTQLSSTLAAVHCEIRRGMC